MILSYLPKSQGNDMMRFFQADSRGQTGSGPGPGLWPEKPCLN